MNQVDLQVEESKLAGVAPVLVDEPTGEVAAEDGAEVVVRYLEKDEVEHTTRRTERSNITHPLQDRGQADLFQQQTR